MFDQELARGLVFPKRDARTCGIAIRNVQVFLSLGIPEIDVAEVSGVASANELACQDFSFRIARADPALKRRRAVVEVVPKDALRAHGALNERQEIQAQLHRVLREDRKSVV